jgi:hypothetical protein
MDSTNVWNFMQVIDPKEMEWASDRTGVGYVQFITPQ